MNNLERYEKMKLVLVAFTKII